MILKREVVTIERRLRAAQITVAELCRTAPVDPGLWQRWKNGVVLKPRPSTWQRVTTAAAEMIAQRGKVA